MLFNNNIFNKVNDVLIIPLENEIFQNFWGEMFKQK